MKDLCDVMDCFILFVIYGHCVIFVKYDVMFMKSMMYVMIIDEICDICDDDEYLMKSVMCEMVQRMEF